MQIINKLKNLSTPLLILLLQTTPTTPKSEELMIFMRLQCMAKDCGEYLLPACNTCVKDCTINAGSYDLAFDCMEKVGCLDREDCFPDREVYYECADVCFERYD